MKEDYDGAEPSASSISLLNLLTLSHLVEDHTWTLRIERTLKAYGEPLAQLGRGVPMMSAALSTYTAGLQQIVIVAGADEEDVVERSVGSRYLPFAIQLRLSDPPTTERRQRLSSLLPFTASMAAAGGASTVYVCRNQTCRAPATTTQELAEAFTA